MNHSQQTHKINKSIKAAVAISWYGFLSRVFFIMMTAKWITFYFEKALRQFQLNAYPVPLLGAALQG